MKTLFFIAALAGAVYLIMQTPAGKAWLQESEPKLDAQHAISTDIQKEDVKKPQTTEQLTQLIDNKMNELAQGFNQKQQTQIEQLENRIAELENELVMGRVTNNQQQSQQIEPSSEVILHPYAQPAKILIASPSVLASEQTFEQAAEQVFDVAVQTQNPLAGSSDNQLQRNRQARLQDIAAKMEMSSLQALVN